MLSCLPTCDVRDLIFSQFSIDCCQKCVCLRGPRWGLTAPPRPPAGQTSVTNRSCPDRRPCFHIHKFTPSYAPEWLHYQGRCWSGWVAIQHGSSPLVYDFPEQEVTAPLSSFSSLSVNHLSIIRSITSSLIIHHPHSKFCFTASTNVPVRYHCFPSCLNLMYRLPVLPNISGSAVLFYQLMLPESLDRFFYLTLPMKLFYNIMRANSIYIKNKQSKTRHEKCIIKTHGDD